MIIGAASTMWTEVSFTIVHISIEGSNAGHAELPEADSLSFEQGK